MTVDGDSEFYLWPLIHPEQIPCRYMRGAAGPAMRAWPRAALAVTLQPGVLAHCLPLVPAPRCGCAPGHRCPHPPRLLVFHSQAGCLVSGQGKPVPGGAGSFCRSLWRGDLVNYLPAPHLPPQAACAGSENRGHGRHPSEGLWGLPLETGEEVAAS